MKISIFTGRACDPQRPQAVKEAARIAHYEHRSDLLILPGDSEGNKKSRKADIQKTADENKIAILAEISENTFLFRPNKSARRFPGQQFAYSNANQDKKPKKKRKGKKKEALVTQREAGRLMDFLKNGERIFELGGKRIAVLLCGENNILKGRIDAKPRYRTTVWPFEHYDILINSAHTSWQRYWLLLPRLKYFSRESRMAIYCTNNTFAKWKNSLCICENGNFRLMGDLENSPDELTHIENNWRIVTVEV
jgi:hypothetical protein